MKTAPVFLMSFFLTASLASQETVRNPDKPLSPAVGRTLKAERVLTVDESSGEFFFKAPGGIQSDSQGNFYVMDPMAGQLLKFSPEGKLLGNLLRVGQGPGELARLAAFFVWRDEIYLSDGLGRLVHLDREGRAVDDTRLAISGPAQVLAITAEGYFVATRKSDPRQRGIVDVVHEVSFVAKDGKSSETIAGFATQDSWQEKSHSPISSFLHAVDPDGRALYVSHTSEYEITKIDLAAKKVAARFTREYARVRFPRIQLSESQRRSGITPPEKDYWEDILHMRVCDHNLWVCTSTNDRAKGRLFDVFDPEGRYIDSFFLPAAGEVYPVDSGFVYVLAGNRSDLRSIGKFKVLNGPKPSK